MLCDFHLIPNTNRVRCTRCKGVALVDRLPTGECPAANKPEPPPPRGPCLHLGPELRREECPTCCGKVLVKVFGCSVHGECALGKKLNGVACCEGCGDWQELTETNTRQLTPMATEHLQRLDAFVARQHEYPEGKFAGRGIVIGAGGAKFFSCAWACVHTLRGLGCTLPVEFWYLDRHEMDPQMLAAAESVGIRCVNARALGRTLPEPPRILNGWELKPFAVLHSAFQEVLYLDADNIPVQDPTALFENDGYRKHGAVFWPDLPPNSDNRPEGQREWLPSVCWENVGLTYRDEPDFESGQFLIDKRRCWKPLNVAMHMNEWSDWYYQFVFGDKSTYHLAWRKCGAEYAMPPFACGWVWPAITQHDFAGQLAFQHCTRGKESIVAGRDLNHLKCWHLVYEAKQAREAKWSGEIYSWREQTGEEMRLAKTAIGTYYYDRVGLGGRKIELADGGIIGISPARCEKRWTLRIIEGVPTVVIIGECHKDSEIGMMFLTESPDGVWRGEWTEYERCPVEWTRQ